MFFYLDYKIVNQSECRIIFIVEEIMYICMFYLDENNIFKIYI